MNKPQVKYTDIHQDLIEKCRRKDSKAQMRVYELYFHAMFNTCLRIIKNEILAEDIMQEAFLTAFEKIALFKGESSFGAWLKRIVINKSLDELKKNRPLFDPLETTPEAFTVKDTEEENTASAEEMMVKIHRIKQALAQLPDGYRIVLSLYLFEGYDHEEISQIMGITESTSRSQFTRAKHKLLEVINTIKR